MVVVISFVDGREEEEEEEKNFVDFAPFIKKRTFRPPRSLT